MSYSDAFSNSFKQNYSVANSGNQSFDFGAYNLPAGSIPGVDASSIPLYDIDFNAPLSIDPALAYSGNFDLSASMAPPAWTFICAPEDISWDTSNAVQRIGIFGTNNPPVVSGSRGMRDLTLGNALVEGFIRNVTVENKIVALEKLLNYNLNASDGFVSVPVYQIWANQKAYGKTGYFVIKDVRVKETMRDLKGDATRATVDVSFMEVPKYQVNSGRDLASQKAAAAKAALIDPKALRGQRQAAETASVTSRVDRNVNSNTRDGAGGPNPGVPPGDPRAARGI
jgi:hypothetical protein